MLSSAKKYVIIGNDAVAVYRINNGIVARISYLVWDSPEFDKDFITSINIGSPTEQVTLLFDMIEQQYKKEILPKINPMDKAKVIKRKVSVAFPNNPIREAMDLKRAPKDGSLKGQMYLFTSIPPCRELEHVVDLLKDTKASIGGLYLLPLEGVELTKDLANKCFQGIRTKEEADNAWTILITYNRTGGLRQVVMRNNELALTRLTPLGSGLLKNPSLAGEIIKEFKSTLTYLARFGYQPTDGMDVIAVCSANDANSLHNAGLPVSHLATPTPAEALNLIKRKLVDHEFDDEANSAGIVHVAWLDASAKRVLPLNFKMLSQIKVPRLAARVLSTILVFTFLGGLGYTGMLLNQKIISGNDLAIQDTMRRTLSAEHEEKSKMFNVLKYPPEQVKVYLSSYHETENRAVNWALYANGIANALGQSGKVKTLEIVPENDKGEIMPGQEATFNPDVTITVTIKFPEELNMEKAQQETQRIMGNLKTEFPTYEVDLPKEAGADVSVEKALQGISGNVANVNMDNMKTDTTVIEMRGKAR